MLTITGLDDFPSQLAVLPLADGRTALAATHLPTPGTGEIAVTKVYLVGPNGAATLLGASEPLGKDVACALEIVGTTLRLYVAEAAPGGGGFTAQVHRYDFAISVGGAGASAVDSVARADIAKMKTGLKAAGT